MKPNNYFVLTGPPGSGKTTLLQYLISRGFHGVGEPARTILAEQRSIGGTGVPEVDPRLFVDLMLSRMMADYLSASALSPPIFFDRGIPDMLAYASHFGFEYLPGMKAANAFWYNRVVFFAPAWREIYATDEERKLSFEGASEFVGPFKDIYEKLGYSIVDIPCISVEERAEFILNSIGLSR